MDRKRPHRGADQRWATFVRNEAKAIVACDFFISVTLSFRVLYVFVAMEIGSRRILHCTVTAHPTAEWTTQQFREVLADLHPYRFIIHDRDSIFSPSLDLTLNDFGVRVIRTPVQAPTTNAFCERLIGTIRRECLDHPSQRAALAADSSRIRCFFNRGRPHSALGPGTPKPIQPSVPTSGHRHGLPSVTESHPNPSSADCITIIGWKRRSLSEDGVFADNSQTDEKLSRLTGLTLCFNFCVTISMHQRAV